MSLTSKVVYQGNLRTRATHLLSGTEIITDAPIDNNGKGESFSPTDMVATALASCMITIMGIRANKMDLDITGATAEIEKIMASDPRRIEDVKIKIHMPKMDFSTKEKKVLEAAARSCPVAISVHDDLMQTITFYW